MTKVIFVDGDDKNNHYPAIEVETLPQRGDLVALSTAPRGVLHQVHQLTHYYYGESYVKIRLNRVRNDFSWFE